MEAPTPTEDSSGGEGKGGAHTLVEGHLEIIRAALRHRQQEAKRRALLGDKTMPQK